MLDKTKKFYDRFYVFYPLVDFFLRSQKRKLSYEINLLPHGNLLEIGAGNGSIIPLYKKHAVTGIDISEAMLRIAASRKYNTDIQLKVMDGERLEFENQSFDYVVINHVLAVTKEPEAMVAEAFRVLKNDGLLFIMNHFTPDNGLAAIDYLFKPFSSFLKFKSVFRPEDIRALRTFQLMNEQSVGLAGYFRLIVYKK